MPSCSTSSNIQASYVMPSVTQGGSRLLTTIPFVSGLTDGQVIRYDVPTSGFTASKADAVPSSEVFGIIESYNSASNTFNVVIYGSINISATKLFDMGSGGACGGNDIYFLSGTTAGALQNLAPTNIDHVVKPLYQAAPHGSYTGLVTNYLGYKIGGDVEAVITGSLDSIGELRFILTTDRQYGPGETSFEDGWLDVSYQLQGNGLPFTHVLPITTYPEYYAKFEKDYGYFERIVVNGSLSGVEVGTLVTQDNTDYEGTLYSKDNSTILVLKDTDSVNVDTTKNLRFGADTTSTTIPITSASIYAAATPAILPDPLPFQIYTGGGSQYTSFQKLAVAMKVKEQGVQVSIPSVVDLAALRADGISLGGQDLEARLASIEAQL